MMLLGIGIDTVQISEAERLLADSPSFEERTFSQEERAAAHASAHPATRFAGLFAVKEAVYKALAPRVGNLDFDLRKIHVEHWTDGSPHVIVDDYLRARMEQAGGRSILISVTNEADFATAIAAAQTEEL